MEYLRLVENNDTQALAGLTIAGFDPWIFCGNVIANFLRDAFQFGVFHADLHPANLLILPNNVVGYVDFGIVAKLTPEARHKQIELTLAYSSGDPDEIYRNFLNICMLTPGADLEGMRRRIAEMARTWYEEPAVNGKVRFKASVTVTMRDLLIVCRNYGVLVDREMIKYIRSTVLVDGVVSRLAPGFDIAHSLRKVVEEYLFEQSRSKVFSSGGAISLLADLAIWMKAGPSSMVRALELLERRQINLKNKVGTATSRSCRQRTPSHSRSRRNRCMGHHYCLSCPRRRFRHAAEFAILGDFSWRFYVIMDSVVVVSCAPADAAFVA